MLHSSVDNIFDELFDDFGSDFFAPRRVLLPGGVAQNNGLMRTDVKELKNSYKLKIDLPGVEKSDIKVKLDNGYLTISAEKKTEETETDKNDGRIIRRERYLGSMSRSWYVGDDIKQEDIKAKYNNGVLSLNIPKKESKPELPEEEKYIAID